MHWLVSAAQTAPALPAAWLIETGARPANLAERSVLRRGLAQRVLASQLRLADGAVAIGHEPAGRPTILTPAGLELHVSLATRSGWVAIGLGRAPVGVDVERIERGAELPLAALHRGEQAMLLALPPPARAPAFARLWSAKEAYVKALGTGFRRSPESFLVRIEEPDSFTVEDPQRQGIARGFSRTMKNGGHEAMAAAFIQLA